MPVPAAAVDHHRRLTRLAATSAIAARRAWQGVGDNFDATWPSVGRRLTALTITAQTSAAALTEPYMAAVLKQTKQPNAPVAALKSSTFAGTAADGRPLRTFLYGAVVAAKVARTRTNTVEALLVGERWLEMATETMIADTSRAAVATAIAVRPDLDGYVRATGGDACSRCRVLTRFYTYDADFARHPRCSCFAVPSSRERASGFAEAGIPTKVRAADLSSLEPAAVTREGRRMPTQILTSITDRNRAIALLRRAGFVT